ncbi:MAG: tetratricopeptide repeat protein [Dolichospermum sp.]|nr:tetratricopeptide repeat protein [Dolichospermum sp.]
MTNNFNKVELKTQQPLETIDFTQSGELVLSQLGIKSATSLLADSSPWEFAHYMAIKNWLMYKPKLNASNLEQVKHYLKVFHHLCEVEAWETACKLIRLTITNTKELHEQLGIWGYHNEQIEIYSRLLTKLNLDLDCLWLDGLGTAYSYLGKAQIAIDYHEKQLEIARKINNRKAEAQAHGGLGWVYAYCLEKAKEAITHYKEQLKISREIDNRKIEGKSLHGLGYSYNILPPYNYQLSMKYHVDALTVAQEISDKDIEYDALGGIAANYINMGEPYKGIEYIRLQLKIINTSYNHYKYCNTLRNLGTSYILLNDYQNAINSFEEALNLVRKINNKQQEADILASLGTAYIYISKKDYKEAINCLQLALITSSEIGKKSSVGIILVNLSYCHGCLKDHQRAIYKSKQAMEIADETGDQQLKALALATLANSYWHQGYIWGHTWGLLLIIRSMLIFPPWKSSNTKLTLKITVRTISKTLKQVF